MFHIKTVSYTHLDVYKRQRNGYAKEYDESRAWCETQKMQDCYIQSVDGLKPVSYTHLDVYKRQSGLPGSPALYHRNAGRG